MSAPRGTASSRSRDANPGVPALCQQLNAEGAIDVTAGTPGCGPGNENDVFQRLRDSSLAFTAPGNRSSTPISAPAVASGLLRLEQHQHDRLCQLDLQLGANHRGAQSQRLTFLAAYTFSKALDDASAFNDLVNFTNPRLSRGLSSSDITHNFVASYVWAIPFDRAFANGPKRLTQGWQMQGITRFSTGFPIQLNQSDGDASLAGSSSTDMPNLVGRW